ncbi:BlaI/MecI/CopY family transcriptional regulator [Thermococcus argininiproducens]|uniref:BlaI/MecI/CopY family transcriptional regulator n=1 Tax=Thermococcus argininiproducens TaxID=2866384 RepID=A0A9E7SDJ1_9EURY|nr:MULTISPECIES: BlaI/MecI/CopY family transcriptional regulator [Thermococcus]OYT32033.1 MAG: ArsR family transcriptional regulator [Archaeoglobales archaeon ex4484_92]RLF79207.1 MAG: ArsR family transcriptional regulator [Thermococci archaeon]MCD6140155.1 BlaI/MecI/CopY family transcriptional regulator [Thermococcus sp.]MCD6142830.1 BlaI/MecI/CopY family transcriptional regulator [Thermococcus sp.]RLF85764.1 MAG: ArsR family transcriptional regulator [Thermococci archaeon]
MPEDQDVEKLSEEVKTLRKALNELMKSFELVSSLAENYLRLINIYAQYGGLGIDVVVPQLRHDPIAREIVKILFDLKSANISQIAQELKKRRGKASRNTVREKLHHLIELNIVEEAKGERGNTYALKKEVLNKWFDLIGIPIKFDQTE